MAQIFISIFLLLSGLIPAVRQSQEPINFNDPGRDAIVIDSPALKTLLFAKDTDNCSQNNRKNN